MKYTSLRKEKLRNPTERSEGADTRCCASVMLSVAAGNRDVEGEWEHMLSIKKCFSNDVKYR